MKWMALVTIVTTAGCDDLRKKSQGYTNLRGANIMMRYHYFALWANASCVVLLV
jgi:uncharacterized lipoprotein YehR (DUF1307 family)